MRHAPGSAKRAAVCGPQVTGARSYLSLSNPIPSSYPHPPSNSEKNAHRRQQLYQNMGAQSLLPGPEPVRNMGHTGQRRRYLGMRMQS